jgi:hypothetical protein
LPQYTQFTSCSPGSGAGRGAAVVKNVYALADLRNCAVLSKFCSSALPSPSPCPSSAFFSGVGGALASRGVLALCSLSLFSAPCSCPCSSAGFTSTAAGDVLLCARVGAAFWSDGCGTGADALYCVLRRCVPNTVPICFGCGDVTVVEAGCTVSMPCCGGVWFCGGVCVCGGV